MSMQTLGCDSEHTPGPSHPAACRAAAAAAAALPAAPDASTPPRGCAVAAVAANTPLPHPALPRPALPFPAGAHVLQVMRLGSPVTSLSLGPAQDLLATCHVGKRGIYLWANQVGCWDGMGWDGPGWAGLGWAGLAWDGMGWDGMGWLPLGVRRREECAGRGSLGV